MKSLVIGYGSIGSRHAKILRELRCPTAVVSGRDIDFRPSYRTLGDALKKEAPEYVVIASNTSEHQSALKQLGKNGFRGVVMVEKPLFSKNEKNTKLSFKNIFVAYNLRQHPMLKRLRELLCNESILSAQCYVGQYLPDWRPKTDYRKSYSASKNKGGGVLRDLSHELDYLDWILGPWKSLTAMGGHYSALDITSDDVFCLLMNTRRCPVVSVQLNYLDRIARRELVINTDRHTFKADLIAGSLQIDSEVEFFKVQRDDTYRFQHEAVIRGKFEQLCSLKEGLDVMRTIETAEKAAREKRWISR